VRPSGFFLGPKHHQDDQRYTGTPGMQSEPLFKVHPAFNTVRLKICRVVELIDTTGSDEQ
jgi:hypothetical protein